MENVKLRVLLSVCVLIETTAAYKGVEVIEKHLHLCSRVSLFIAALRNQLDLFGQINRNEFLSAHLQK